MRLLPRVFKYYEDANGVENYQFMPIFGANVENEQDTKTDDNNDGIDKLTDFLEDLQEDEYKEPTPLQEDENAEAEAEEDTQDDEIDDTEEESIAERIRQAKLEAEEILENANNEAQKLLADAQEEAEIIKKEAYSSAYDLGTKEGFQAAFDEQNNAIAQETNQFFEELKAIINDVENTKVSLLQKYRKDMKNIAIAVGEKVVQISLKSSGGVIERMIETATEKLKRKEWMKVYIAKCDADMLMEGDSQLLKNLNYISKHVKLIVMENETPGTCIIELPDEIIDASASTQIENIKEILNNASI